MCKDHLIKSKQNKWKACCYFLMVKVYPNYKVCKRKWNLSVGVLTPNQAYLSKIICSPKKKIEVWVSFDSCYSNLISTGFDAISLMVLNYQKVRTQSGFGYCVWPDSPWCVTKSSLTGLLFLLFPFLIPHYKNKGISR